jgi:hypothetical protein
MRLSILSPNFTRKPLFPFMRDTLLVLPVLKHDCRRLAFLSCLDSTVIHTSSVTCLSVLLSVPNVLSVSTVSADTRFNNEGEAIAVERLVARLYSPPLPEKREREILMSRFFDLYRIYMVHQSIPS